MKPLDPPSLAPEYLTLGSIDPGSNVECLLKWAAAHDCAGAAVRLANVLFAAQQSEWLGDIIDLLAANQSILVEWEEKGARTFGLAALASDVRGREREAIPNERRVLARKATLDFPPKSSNCYLQLALVCRRPQSLSADETAGYNALRIWLLLEALQRAESGSRLDNWLRAAASGLRQAGEDTLTGEWRQTVLELAPPLHSFSGMRLYLMSRTSALLADKEAFPPSKAKSRFLEAVGEIARGHTDPIEGEGSGSPPWLPAPLLPSEASRWTAAQAELPEAQPWEDFTLDAGIQSEGDDDGSSGVVTTQVDPDRLGHEQQVDSRYIYLVSAARARLVRWAWDVVNPNELDALEAKITLSYKSSKPIEHALAALSDVCLASGRSLAAALKISFGERAQSPRDWVLSLADACLYRQPPRRGWHAKALPKMADHLTARSAWIGTTLSAECVQTLIQLAHAGRAEGSARQLQDIWPDNTITPAQAFLDWVRDDPVLGRITPGMLGSVCERKLYQTTQDWLKSRLLASPADSGLPAASAYASYTGAEVTAALDLWRADDLAGNAAGSLIASAETFYRHGLARACTAVDVASAGPSFIDHHNRVSLYWDAVLRAGTGVRPSDGLWVWSNFDLDGGFAFVDDKTGIDESAARWVLLPKRLIELIEASYLGGHLPSAVEHLDSEFGSAASSAIELLRKTLVWLRVDNGVVTAEPLGVRHRKLHKEDAPEFPLVANAFRHRARTVWRRHGCDQEIVDSLLGHSDGATRTHGDFSPRVWATDAAAAMPAINAAFDALEVRAPKSWQGLELPAVQSSSLKRGEPTHANLGHESRDTSRWRTLLRAARETVSELSITSIQVDPAVAADLRFNNPRLPLKIIWARMPTWSREQFSALVKTLTTTGQGMPATLGHLRMMVLGHLVDGCWRETGKTVKLHRRSFKGFLRDEPRATAAAAGARERLSKWRLTFDSISAAAPVGKVSAADAGALLVADLIIHARVADSEVLQDACRGKVRVVCRGQAHFLEWSSDDELPANGHGVLRHRISAFAATMVGVVQSTTVLRHSSLSYVSKRLHPLLKAMSLAAPASVADIVRIALPTIDALNCMELPGNVAAARAGRFRTASRSWPDWTRTQDGSFIGITGSEEKGDGDESVLDRAPATPLLYFSESPPQSRTQGRAFTKEIRAILGWHRIGGVDAKVDPSMRRSMARAVEVTCRKFEPLVSPALHCLGLWCHSLFERDHGQDKIRVSTIRRYFSALTAPFESLAHDLDLRELDEEEVTALFQEVLDCRNLAKPSYVRARLREFDRHCAKAFGTQSPDWSELAVEDTGIGISPGHLDEAAYLRLFSQLASAADANLARQSRLMALLGYRFGLRCAEAALLRVKDVVRYGKAVHVVVERLKRRDTKSNRGRRTVPLLFVLSEDEQQLLDDVMLQAKKRQEVDKAALLLSDPANPAAIINAAAIAKAVATEMKQSTGNVRLSEHHLRHSFACAIWQALEVPLDQLPDEISREGSRRIRTLLLAEERIGRRAPWALASVLGHSHPSNAYRSYVHFLCERADHLLSAGLGATPPIGSWAKMVDLDKAERQVPPPRSIVAGTASLVAPNMQVIVLCLQLLAASDSTPNIAASLKVAPDWLSRLERVYRSVSLRVASEASEDKTKRYGKLAQKGLLGHILRTGLPRIVTALEGLERLVEKSARAMTTPEDEYFIGMMGYRRQISFWTETQMIFLRRALEDLGLERGRLNLLCPSKLSSKVTTIAQSSGWIETSTNRPMSATESKPRTFPLIPTIGSRQEPTKFGDPEYTVTDRLSLELSIREGVGIGNRLEFIFALVCIWAWSVARSPAPTANSVSK